ncbi:MAG: GntR family transcriptional regulator [Bacteroidota bacterium]
MHLRINHNSGIPLHLQVEELLRKLVELPEYTKGKMFPKEVDIAQQLGISRNTVRQAISKLVIEGLLERKKGVGTKVAEQNISTRLKSWMSFTQEMNKKDIAFINYEIKVEKVLADEEVANVLEIEESTEVIKLSRLRGDSEGPFVHFISWLHPRIGLSKKEDFSRPLYEILEKDYSTVVDLSKEKIMAVCAEKKIANKLQISDTNPVLKRIRKVYDPGKRPIEYNIGYYRADKFSYTIDIKREFK